MPQKVSLLQCHFKGWESCGMAQCTNWAGSKPRHLSPCILHLSNSFAAQLPTPHHHHATLPASQGRGAGWVWTAENYTFYWSVSIPVSALSWLKASWYFVCLLGLQRHKYWVEGCHKVWRPCSCSSKRVQPEQQALCFPFQEEKGPRVNGALRLELFKEKQPLGKVSVQDQDMYR